MSYTTFIDVTCLHCAYEGPAALLQIPATDYFLEHTTVICPECSYGWVVNE